MTTETYVWHENRRTITVTHAENGWQAIGMDRLEPCRTALARRLAGREPCQAVAEWKVQEGPRNRRQFGTVTFYCSDDLPADRVPAPHTRVQETDA